MKKYLRLSLLNTISLFVVSTIFPGLVTPSNLLELLYSGVIFTIINIFVKPIIKLFLLPINLITLGLFRWLSNVLVLFILTNLINNLEIISFTSSTINQAGFTIPSLNFNYLASLILASFLLSLMFNIANKVLTSSKE
jgi:putative membrane protein